MFSQVVCVWGGVSFSFCFPNAALWGAFLRFPISEFWKFYTILSSGGQKY